MSSSNFVRIHVVSPNINFLPIIKQIPYFLKKGVLSLSLSLNINKLFLILKRTSCGRSAMLINLHYILLSCKCVCLHNKSLLHPRLFVSDLTNYCFIIIEFYFTFNYKDHWDPGFFICDTLLH